MFIYVFSKHFGKHHLHHTILEASPQEMGLEVAQFRSEKMLRASQLSRQLSEEEMITSSLTQLVQQQAEVLKNLEENG